MRPFLGRGHLDYRRASLRRFWGLVHMDLLPSCNVGARSVYVRFGAPVDLGRPAQALFA